MSGSAALLAAALVLEEPTLATTGASVFVLGLASDLRIILHAARQYRAGAEDPWAPFPRSGIPHRVSRVIEFVIVIGGMITLLRSQDHPSLFLPGAIIWFGELLIYFVSGLLVRQVAGIPLRMGYGGWDLPRRRV